MTLLSPATSTRNPPKRITAPRSFLPCKTPASKAFRLQHTGPSTRFLPMLQSRGIQEGQALEAQLERVALLPSSVKAIGRSTSSIASSIPRPRSLRQYGPSRPSHAEVRWVTRACFLSAHSFKRRFADHGQVTRPCRSPCTTSS